jgi:hypothetical protein
MRRHSLTSVCAAAVLLMFVSACSDDNGSGSTPTPPSCTFVVAATTSLSTSAAASTVSVSVTAAPGCAWTATSNASFITITAGAAGTGNGTVAFAVAVNTGAERTGTVTVAGSTLTITQGAAAVTSTLAPPTAISPVGGQTITTPTFVVNNAVATGAVGTVTYRFEISDQPTFPVDISHTFTADGVAQGSGGTTSFTLNRDLDPDVLWYWHARATNGTITTEYSATETFRPASRCTFTVTPTTPSVAGGGGTVTLTVTTASGCAWSASSNASFITVASGTSGTGSGTVTLTVASNAGAARSGTVTVAGQSVTVSQAAGGLVVSFRMRDPAISGAAAVTSCLIRASNGSTCVLESTSFPLGTSAITNYSWTVQYTYATVKTLTQSSSSSTFSFTDSCGGIGSTDDGVLQPLSVTLTITDSQGSTATATSGAGDQPALFLRLFKC